MSERDQQPHEPGSGVVQESTAAPGTAPIRGGAAAEPAPAPGYAPGAWGTPDDATEPEYSSRPVAFRRPDAVAGLLLVLAGVAAAVSLLLPWVAHVDASGWDIVHAGIRAARAHVGGLFTDGYWEPLAVVGAGAALFVLGLLMFLRARTHRFLGLLALLAALLATAGVLTPMAQDHWTLSTYALGMWFAVAVAGLGLLGALKAMLTGPRLGTQQPRG